MKPVGAKLSDVDMKKLLGSHTDRRFLTYVLILTVVGLVMLYSVSYANGIYYMGDGLYYIRKQSIFAVIGLVFMLFLSYVPYQIYHKLAGLAFLVCESFLWATLFFPAINNSKRWIHFGGFSFQPSEAMKFCLVLILSHLISLHPEQMPDFKKGFLKCYGFIVAVAIPMMLQPHLSGTIILALIGFAVMWVGGVRLKHFLIGGAGTLALMLPLVLFVEKFKYALQRIITATSGGDISSDAYQTYQSMIAVGSGGLFGLGLGNSRQKQLYVPFAQNDFIFSIVCEELGFVGALAIIILFMVLIVRGIRIAMTCRDRFGALLVSGIMAELSLQVTLNIAVVTGVINTGIALPFFSQGGTALFILLCEMGVVLSVARYNSNDLRKEKT